MPPLIPLFEGKWGPGNGSCKPPPPDHAPQEAPPPTGCSLQPQPTWLAANACGRNAHRGEAARVLEEERAGLPLGCRPSTSILVSKQAGDSNGIPGAVLSGVGKRAAQVGTPGLGAGADAWWSADGPQASQPAPPSAPCPPPPSLPLPAPYPPASLLASFTPLGLWPGRLLRHRLFSYEPSHLLVLMRTLLYPDHPWLPTTSRSKPS